MNAITNRRKAIEAKAAQAMTDIVTVAYERAELDSVILRHGHMRRAAEGARVVLPHYHDRLMAEVASDARGRKMLETASPEAMAALRLVESIMRDLAVAFSDEVPHE